MELVRLTFENKMQNAELDVLERKVCAYFDVYF